MSKSNGQMSERMRIYYEREANIKKLAEFCSKSSDKSIAMIADELLGTRKSFRGQLDSMFEKSKTPNKVHENDVWNELKIGRQEMKRIMKDYEKNDIEVSFDGTYYIKK
jgi:hypothetical protein